MIDLHSHLLPGLDDGATTLDESLTILRALAADGVSVVAATPHVRHDYPTTPGQLENGLALVRLAAREAGIRIEIVGGGEVAFECLTSQHPDETLAFALAGNRGFLLVEFPYLGWPPNLAEGLATLVARGTRPVLAHPERNPSVQAAPMKLEALVDNGALIQVTAGSLMGTAGREARETALRLVRAGLAHMVASDVHGVGIRRPTLAVARPEIRGDALWQWLTNDVPGAIVRASPLPDRPPDSRRRLPFLRR